MTTVQAPPATLRMFDLCAGIGGFRAAADALSADIVTVASSEFDKYVVQTYEAMWPSAGEAMRGDITQITRSLRDIGAQRFLGRDADRTARIKDVLPEFDVLCAGFPCQPHSLMGSRKGFEDDRGSLFYDIAAVIEATLPSYVVLENVRAIRSVNDGQLFADILGFLERTGYHVRHWTLDAAAYGVPQRRRRVFIAASKNPLPLEHPPETPVHEREYRTAWHALEREVDERYYLSERILETVLKDQHGGYRRRAEINQLTARPLTRTMHKMHRASQDNYYSDDFVAGVWDEALGDVVRDPLVAPRIRRITPREALRLQGFPGELIERALASGVSDTRLYMHAGNAVPPPMARAVLEHVIA